MLVPKAHYTGGDNAKDLIHGRQSEINLDAISIVSGLIHFVHDWRTVGGRGPHGVRYTVVFAVGDCGEVRGRGIWFA